MDAKLSEAIGTDTLKWETATGRAFVFRPLTMLDIANAEDHFGCDMAKWEEAGHLRKIRSLLFLLWLSLSKTEPELTVESLGAALGASDMERLVRPIQFIVGIKAPEKNGSGAGD